MKYVIFSIDNEADEEARRRFRTWFEAVNTKGNLLDMQGCYMGQKERSFMCLTSSFNRHVRGSDWVAGQESILYVSECNKMYATLEFLAADELAEEGTTLGIGCMHQVDKEEALASDNWTYSPARDIYWVAKVGNPDKVNGDPLEEGPETRKSVWQGIKDYWFDLVSGFVLLVVGIMISASTAEAQAAPQDTIPEVGYHMLSNQPDGAVMALYLLNQITVGAEDEEYVYLQTPYGLFTVLHENTPNDECGLPLYCPDSLTVVDWPEGFGFDAMTINVDERDAGHIRVYRWEGV